MKTYQFLAIFAMLIAILFAIELPNVDPAVKNATTWMIAIFFSLAITVVGIGLLIALTVWFNKSSKKDV